MVIRYLKPGDRVIHWAHRISHFAHMPWVVGFFFLIFLVDSFLLFLPADGLIAVSVLFAPDKKRVWFLMAVLGSLLGFVILYALTISSFEKSIVDFIVAGDAAASFHQITKHAARYGYLALGVGVFTFVPPGVSLMAGIVIGLNPLAVLGIVFASKVFRIWLMIFLVQKLWKAVILLGRKIKHRVDKQHGHTDEEVP